MTHLNKITLCVVTDNHYIILLAALVKSIESNLMKANYVDYHISEFLNHFCGRRELFDRTIVFLSNNHVLKGGVIIIIIWFIWFDTKSKSDLQKQHLVSTLLGGFLGIVASRLITHTLSFRVRPILNPANHLIEAFGLNKSAFDKLSSFPSDHCALFFALVTGIFFASRKWGLVSVLYVLLFIALPRVYLGLHYFTDVLCGAAIGVAIAILTNASMFREKISARIVEYSTSKPAIFYPLFFFISFEIVELFTSVRTMATFVYHPYANI
jgi:undecaprenyl-diphosphatase